MARIQHPDFRDELETTNYPFTDTSTLTNGTQSLLQGSILDASLYPIGGGVVMYLSKAVITHQEVQVFIGDDVTDELASATFDLVSPPDILQLVDEYNRPAGIIVSDSVRLGVFQTWGTGTHVFTPDQTAFVPSVCVPTPEIGVRGVLLDDGSVLTGDLWLVGDDGVVLRTEDVEVPAEECGDASRTQRVIRVDIVGDPLFRRRLCQTTDLFDTPRFIKQITFSDDTNTFVATPDSQGDLQLTINNNLAADTVLRSRPTQEGLLFEAVGSELEDVQ